jgi:hypothetical protein
MQGQRGVVFDSSKRPEKISCPLSVGRDHSMNLTRAITPIRLCEVNNAKVAALDAP